MESTSSLLESGGYDTLLFQLPNQKTSPIPLLHYYYVTIIMITITKVQYTIISSLLLLLLSLLLSLLLLLLLFVLLLSLLLLSLSLLLSLDSIDDDINDSGGINGGGGCVEIIIANNYSK